MKRGHSHVTAIVDIQAGPQQQLKRVYISAPGRDVQARISIRSTIGQRVDRRQRIIGFIVWYVGKRYGEFIKLFLGEATMCTHLEVTFAL